MAHNLAGSARKFVCRRGSIRAAVAHSLPALRMFDAGVSAMDVGITKSHKSHPIHFLTGLIVVTMVYSAAMFAVRAIVM